MASVTRQPFAPLDGARLQNLTSLKNRQNAISSSPATSKRKAESLDTDDTENVDPLLFAKRSKAAKSSNGSAKDGVPKPSNFVLKAASPKPTPTPSSNSTLNATATPRRTIQPKSPAAKLNTNISKSSPLSAPAGRSPTRGKRSGILSNRRRTAGPFSRVDPPSFNLGGGNNAAPFSLDAALKGTIPSYASRSSAAKPASGSKSSLNEPELKASWFFDIHEDTPEQEMTNMLQHSTCVLDISSDEESAQRARREGREDKENVPPVDDVSQTSARAQERLRNRDEMIVEKERVALGEMKAADFYAEGCDESSVIIVPADEEEEQRQGAEQHRSKSQQQKQEPIAKDFEFAPELKQLPSAPSPEAEAEPAMKPDPDFDMLMGRADEAESSSKAAVLQPIEGTSDSFELWESGSAKDENEAAPSAAEASS